MNLNYSESQSAAYKSQLAVRALFEVIKLTHCEQTALEFVHKLSQMAELPEEVQGGIEWFNDERLEAAWALNDKLTAEARSAPLSNDDMGREFHGIASL